MQVAKQHTERYADRYGGVTTNTRAASRSARVRGGDPASLHRRALARSDRETWAGSGINIIGSPGGSLKYLSKAARSKVDQDDPARWGTAGRCQSREPTSETPTRAKYSNSSTSDAKGTAPGIHIFCLKPVPPCMPYSYDKKGSPRERAREIVRPTGARTAAAYVRGSTESGENNFIFGGGSSSGGGGGGSVGGPATLFGSFALEVRPRQSEEGGNILVSSRERAARDVQSFFRRTSRSRGCKCGRWAGETWREEERRSIVHSQISGEGVVCRRCHYDGTCSDDVATPACSQTVNNVISHCSADTIALSQSSVDTPPLSKVRLRVIAAWWTSGVVNAAITRITTPSAVHHGEERRLLPSPENALLIGSARVVARDVMADVTEVCLLYAVLAHDLRPTTSTAELEKTPLPSSSSSSEAMTSAEANHACARNPGTGNHSSWAERRRFAEETHLNRVSDASANSLPAHGVAHIFFPTPPCSTALALPDQADSSCTGISSLLAQQGGASSSALFARLDGGETEEVDDRSTLTVASVLNGGSPANAAEDRSVADVSNRVLFDGSTGWDNAGGYPGKPDTSEAFTPIDAPIANKARDISEERSSVHCSDTVHEPMANQTMATPEDKPSVYSPRTADQADTRRSEKCVPEGGFPAQTAALQVSFAGVGTRPAVAVRSSVTSGLTRKGGGFLFKKRWCSPRPEYGGDGDGGGGSADGSGGGESMASFISFSTIGPDGPGEISPRSSSLTGLPRGEPANASDVAATGLGSGAIVGRRCVLPLRTRSCSRHAHPVIIGDRSLKGAGAGDNRDTGGMAHTIFGVAIDVLSKAANGGADIPSGYAGEEPPAVDRRCRVLVSGHRVPRSDPGRSRRAFPVMGEGAGVDAETYRGGGDSAATESSSRGGDGSVSIRTAVNADDVCVKLAQRAPRKPPRGANTRSSMASPRKILYRGVATR